MPELVPLLRGDAMFSRECPGWIIALLSGIDEHLRFYPHGYFVNDAYDSPFLNTGAKLTTEVFTVQAYEWDEDIDQPWNFKYGDIEVRWYKHYQRGTTINREVTPDEAVAMYHACVASLPYHRSLDGLECQQCGETERNIIAALGKDKTDHEDWSPRCEGCGAKMRRCPACNSADSW